MSIKSRTIFYAILNLLILFYTYSYAQEEKKYNLNFKMYYDINVNLFPISIGFQNELGEFSSLCLTPSFSYKRHELYCGPLFSKKSASTDEGKSDILMGGNLGYNFSLIKNPRKSNLFLFYSFQLVKHFTSAELLYQGTHYANLYVKEKLLCNIFGVGTKVFLHKKRRNYLYFSLGYSFLHYYLQSKYILFSLQETNLYNSEGYNWKRVYASVGLNIRLKTFYNN